MSLSDSEPACSTWFVAGQSVNVEKVTNKDLWVMHTIVSLVTKSKEWKVNNKKKKSYSLLDDFPLEKSKCR